MKGGTASHPEGSWKSSRCRAMVPLGNGTESGSPVPQEEWFLVVLSLRNSRGGLLALSPPQLNC